MYIGEIISQDTYAVEHQDSLRFALQKMDDLQTQHLPLVSAGDYLGLLSMADMLTKSDNSFALGELKLDLKPLFQYENQHLYDALQYMSIHKLAILPVLDESQKFLGVITVLDLLLALNSLLGNSSSGAILVLELAQTDNALAQVAHIIEAENIRILNTAIRTLADSDRLEMTIKVDQRNITALVATLWRYNYLVKATFNDNQDHTDTDERYASLMNYLNL